MPVHFSRVTFLFWICAACCVLAEVAILRSLLFGRARAAEEQHARDESRVGHEVRPADVERVARATRPTEVAWAIIPAAGLLLVLYLTWRAVDPPTSPPADVGRIGATIGA